MSSRATLDPTCFQPGQPTTLTVFGYDFAANDNGYATYDPNGPDPTQTRIRIPIDASGSWAT